MGVGITNLVEKKEIKLEDLTNGIVAVDAFNIIYQFITTIRQYDGTPLRDSNGEITSHLSGLFYRSAKLLENRIKPVFVFDGKPPEFKLVNEERNRRREEAAKLEEEARERGDFVAAKKYAQQSSKITPTIIEESKEILTALGIPWVQAPSEGEAQASYMCREGKVWSVVSQDMDCLLFGTPRLARNVGVTAKRKLPGKMKYVEAPVEIIELKPTLKSLGLTQKQLIMLGLIVGTDFNPGGIEGLGPKKALNYVKTNGDLSDLEWKWDMSPNELIEFFENPPITDEYELKWENPSENLSEILLKRGFSEDRIKSTIDKLNKIKSVSSLDKWL